jgi:TRAP-type C4-dicarboxylate transport system permease small subunit
MKFFQKLSLMEKIILGITASMLGFIAGLTLVQVFYRYVLNNALTWTAELTKIIFIWMTFLGSSVALNRGRHLRIDTFINLVSNKSRTIIDIIVHLIVIGMLGYLLYYGVKLSQQVYIAKTSALRLPRTVLVLPIPLGALLMIIFSIRIVINDVKQIKEKYEVED